MIRSMTGFGSAQAQCGPWALRAEARSVNHKDLRVSFHLPETVRVREVELQRLIEKELHRGHIYIVLTCEPAGDSAEVLLDSERLKRYVATLRALADAEKLPFQVDLTALLRLPGALRDIATDAELGDELWPGVVSVVESALARLLEMREAEGAHILTDLRKHCARIGELVRLAEAGREELLRAYRDRLKERVEALLAGSDVPVSDEVLARELALYAERSDVAEEASRLRSHLAQFDEALDSGEPAVGRKLEFLGQEMLREASTMSAKMPAGAAMGHVLDLRNVIEKLREQVRNVE